MQPGVFRCTGAPCHGDSGVAVVAVIGRSQRARHAWESWRQESLRTPPFTSIFTGLKHIQTFKKMYILVSICFISLKLLANPDAFVAIRKCNHGRAQWKIMPHRGLSTNNVLPDGKLNPKPYLVAPAPNYYVIIF